MAAYVRLSKMVIPATALADFRVAIASTTDTGVNRIHASTTEYVK